MPSDRSLDEFVETDGESDDTGDGSEATDTCERSDATDPEPNDSDTARPSHGAGDVDPVPAHAALTA